MGAISGWFGGSYGEPAYYDYGDNIYYEGDTVYEDGEAIATSAEYAEQAETLATSAIEPPADAEWLPLGVFAMTQDGKSSGPAPTIFLQLNVSKDGVIAGTVTNTEIDSVEPIEGMVDLETQRTAMVVTGKSKPIVETGLSNLTKDESPALLHFGDGKTEQWLLIRVEEPKGEGAAN